MHKKTGFPYEALPGQARVCHARRSNFSFNFNHLVKTDFQKENVNNSFMLFEKL